MPAPTLEFAGICLRSALFLLPNRSADSGTPPTCSALPGAPIKGNDIINLRCVLGLTVEELYVDLMSGIEICR